MLKFFKQNQSPATFFEQGYAKVLFAMLLVAVIAYELFTNVSITGSSTGVAIYKDGTLIAASVFFAAAIAWPIRYFLKLKKITITGLLKFLFFGAIAACMWMYGFDAVRYTVVDMFQGDTGQVVVSHVNFFLFAFCINLVFSIVESCIKPRPYIAAIHKKTASVLYGVAICSALFLALLHMIELPELVVYLVVVILTVAPTFYAVLSAVQVFKNDPVTVRKSTSKVSVSTAKAQKEEGAPKAKPAKPPLHVRLYASFLETVYKGLGKLKRKL